MIQPDLQSILAQKLDGAVRVAVLTVGSSLRADDAAGVLVGEELERILSPSQRLRMQVFAGETAPENLSGEIKKYAPGHLLIVDAADLGQAPGYIGLLEPRQTDGQMPACTHLLPVFMLIRYLQHFLKCQTIIMGIQGSRYGFGGQPCVEVEQAAKEAAAIIAAAVESLSHPQ